MEWYFRYVPIFANSMASTQVLNFMKQMAGAPCTQRSFRFRTYKEGSNSAYTTEIIYRSRSIMRGLNHTLELRSVRMTEQDTVDLGMKPNDVDAIQDSGGWPTMKVCNDLNNVKYLIPKRREGNPVLNGFLSPYIHWSVASDHSLGAISKCLMAFCSLSVIEHGKIRSSDLMPYVK